MRLLLILLAVLALPAFAAVTPLPGATPQRGTARSAFPNPIAVRVTDDAGGPVAGASVTLYLRATAMRPAGGYQPNDGCNSYINDFSCTVRTDAEGIARFTPLAADWAGTSRATVTATTGTYPNYITHGQTTIELTADPIREPARLSMVQGNDQRLVAGIAAAPIVVQLRGPDGTPLRQEKVYGFSGASGGFQCPANICHEVLTDDNGIASFPRFVGGPGLGEFEGYFLYLDYQTASFVRVPLRYTVTNPEGSMTVDVADLWWGGPAESGWGMSLNQQGNVIFNVWFVYDASSRPTWYVMPGGEWSSGAVGGNYFGTIYSPRSAPWYAYDASQFVPGAAAGTGNVQFGNPDSAHTGLSVYGSGDGGATAAYFKQIVRQPIGSGPATPMSGLGGLWWGGPSQNGWGIAIHQKGSKLFLVWFTYDAEGRPTWFVMPDGGWIDDRTFDGSVYRTTGPAWSFLPFNTNAVTTTRVGNYRLRFTTTDRARFEVTIEGRSVALDLLRQIF